MFISNHILDASQLVEGLTNHYYIPCDTIEEARKYLGIQKIEMQTFTLTELDNIPDNAVMVRFLKQNNAEYRCVIISNEYVSKFKQYLAEENLL